MQWPPNKAWTSASLRKGFRHFVAVNYGGRGAERWVHLVSVLDAKARLRVPWQEMKDPEFWISGWLQLPRAEINEPEMTEEIPASENFTPQNLSCLHPSEDFDSREWFDD